MAKQGKAKRLTRSREGRMVGGILAGIGEYVDVDPTAVRVAYVLAAFLTGMVPMVLAYAVLLFVIPLKE
jgi:phage shock protein C